MMGINVGDKYIIEIGAVAELPDGKKKYFIKPFESLVFDRKGLEQLKKFDNAADALYQAGFKKGYKKAQSRPDLKQLKDDSYSKGYEDGAKNQDEVQYQKGYNKGLEDGRAEATYNTDLIDELKQVEYIRGLEDARHAIDVLKNMTVIERAEWFEGHVGVNDVVCTFTIQQIIDSTNAYEQKKKAEEKFIKVGDEVIYLPNNTKFYVIGESPNRYKGICYAEYNKYLPILICDFEKDNCKKTGRHLEEISQLLYKMRGKDNDNN